MSSEVVTPETLLAGFEQAHDRARIAARGLEQMPMYFAIFETLNWAASLDDRLGKPRTGDSVQDDHLSGLLHARNRTHHQWADAFVFDTGVTAVFGHAVYDRAQYGRTHPSTRGARPPSCPSPTAPASRSRSWSGLTSERSRIRRCPRHSTFSRRLWLPPSLAFPSSSPLAHRVARTRLIAAWLLACRTVRADRANHRRSGSVPVG